MSLPARTENPFGKSQEIAAHNSAASSDEQRAIQEVQAAMVIAKKFPRNTIEAMDRILNACTRPTLANAALYSYPRGGQEVTGPSIRLAEALAQEWGNIQFGIRELSASNGASTVEAFAWDMETNTRQVKVFQVPHARWSNSKGLTALKDPRDIYEMIANQGARRLRACILGVIPGDVTEAAVQQCDVTQTSAVEVNPETIKKLLEAFEGYGVSQELIEKRIGRRADAINAPQILNLRKIYQSMKDGMSKPSDWFDIAEIEQTVGPKSSDLNDQLAPKTGKKKPAAKAEDPAPAASAEPLTFASITAAINAATSVDALESVPGMMAEFVGTDGNEQFKEELGEAYRWKLSQLKKAAE